MCNESNGDSRPTQTAIAVRPNWAAMSKSGWQWCKTNWGNVQTGAMGGTGAMSKLEWQWCKTALQCPKLSGNGAKLHCHFSKWGGNGAKLHCDVQHVISAWSRVVPSGSPWSSARVQIERPCSNTPTAKGSVELQPDVALLPPTFCNMSYM